MRVLIKEGKFKGIICFRGPGKHRKKLCKRTGRITPSIININKPGESSSRNHL